MSSLQPALQALSAQQAQQTAAQNQQRQAIQQATNQFLQYVQGQPSVVNDYTQAANTVGDLAKNAGQFMQQANPADAINSIVSRLNPEQAAAIQARLGNVYNGGAQVLDTTQGFIPGSLLAEQGAHAAAFQKSQLPNVALQGINNLKQFAYNANTADQALAAKKADLLAQIPGLTQKAQIAASNLAATQAYRNAELGLGQERVNASIQNAKTLAGYRSAELGLSSQRLQQQQNQFIARHRAEVAKFNAQQQAASTKLALPSASLSRANGYLTAVNGKPILGADGKRQILPGFQANQNGGVTKVTKVNSKNTLSASSVQSFVKSLLVPTYDKAGKRAQNPDGTRTNAFRMTYVKAYKYLVSRGVGDVDARTALDTVYPKGQGGDTQGQGGRAWLTNEEQAALRSRGYLGTNVPAKAMIYVSPKGERLGYLTPRQYQLLQSAGVAPVVHPGAPNGGLWIDPNG